MKLYISNKLEMYGLVLCAGKGTRMEPLSKTIPKPLLPIDQTPVLSQLIQMLQKLSISKIGIVINEEKRKIFQNFIKEYHSGVNIDVFIQEKLTGVVTAILSADKYKNQSLLATAGDTIYPNLTQVNEMIDKLEQGADIVIGVQERSLEEIMRRSNVVLDKQSDKVISTTEKPTIDQIEGNYSGVPIWCFSKRCWPLLEQTQPVANKERVIEGTIMLAKNTNYRVKAVEITETKDITYPNDILFHNFPYISKLLS